MTPINEAPFPDSLQLGSSKDTATSKFVVLKFGGTSVADADKWQTILGLIDARIKAGLHPVVVVSALFGTSNLLDELCNLRDIDHCLQTLITQHTDLGNALGVDTSSVLKNEFGILQQCVENLKRIKTRSSGNDVQAEPVALDLVTTVMSLGELMSSRLGAAYLNRHDIPVTWLDAREHLKSAEQNGRPDAQQRLNALCQHHYDDLLSEQLRMSKASITQGFIGSNQLGETVLLGRGGSDTSATCFASMLGARRVEIWTDVPGLFSADPRSVPSARLLQSLHYDEAQEIAAMGAAVLHPKCLTPPAQSRIPVFVRCTETPHHSGTTIAHITPDAAGQVKAITLRNGLRLLSLESVTMWQEIGFLAKAFAQFDRFGVSIDLVSTSESNVTVSIDPISSNIKARQFAQLLDALGTICKVSIIDNCSSVSLVGRNIRTMLHKLGPAMSVFEEHKIHLVSQSASDLNLTFVVDQVQGERLARELHDAVIKKDDTHAIFGPSWSTLQSPQPTQATVQRWWEQKADELLALLGDRQCAYVYDLATIAQRAKALVTLPSIDAALYAMKANSNPEVLRTAHRSGLHFECVSPGEIEHLFATLPGLKSRNVLYTPNFAARSDYQAGFDKNINVTLDNLYPLRYWGEDFNGKEIFVRLDPGRGRGHHELVKTAGSHSKFGIPLFELEELRTLATKNNCTIVGIHAHVGSGVMDADNWRNVGEILATAARTFSTVRTVDVGGGLGVPEKPGDASLNLIELEQSLSKLKHEFPEFSLWMEPGRYIVAESGVLLARVTQTKGKGEIQYVGAATGMNSLIRPALYGAYHEIVNLSRLSEPSTERYTIVGPNCETGDRLGMDRYLPVCRENDILLIANTGAYGHVMSSRYNLREPAMEMTLPF